MRYQIAVDIEDALRQDLKTAATAGGVSIYAAAPPVPENLGTNLPFVVPERVGGQRDAVVIDFHNVSIDVYAKTWGAAQGTANKLVGIVSELPDIDGLTVDYLEANITTLPYNNPDPRHQDIPRVTFAATVICRAAQSE